MVESTPKIYAQVIKKVRASLLAKTEHEALRKQKLSENVNSLTQLEATIRNLGLGVHCEIESVAGVTNTSFLSVTASDCKVYSESVGPFHRVKLLISPEGSYELRVNIVDRVETGKVDLDDVGKLRQVVANITGNSFFRICPGLTRDPKYSNIQAKLGYQPKNLLCQEWPWLVIRHHRCAVWHQPRNRSVRHELLFDCCENCKVRSLP